MGAHDVKLIIHTANMPERVQPNVEKVRRVRIHARSSFQERLLRNTFIACAILLGVLALNNVRQPWAERVSSQVQQALTMTIDLDQSIGQLSFVRSLMPESALVFFDLAKETEMCTPVTGTPTHVYSDAEPYLMFRAAESTPVRAAANGTISAISTLSDGTRGILVDHGDGLESVTCGLNDVEIKNGDAVQRGDALGTASTDVYFELRQQNTPVDPSARMGL